MKNLKKTLSLVLIVTMMLSVLVVGAGAAFTDETDVEFKEAVEVLSAIKVLEGFDDGSFKPDQTLTREQAAKIISYALIGKTAADALTTGTAPFSDVAASRWSAGYIAFCVQQGIINGYGNGKFGPADTLTGFAFGKMLLTALGYGKKGEFTGDNWTIEVAKLAIPLGIYEGNTAGASNTPCTREAAALYAFNAMTGTMTVNYSDALGIYYSGLNALVAPDADDEYKYTLGYKTFRLQEEPADFGGRIGRYWNVNGVRVSSFWSTDTVLGKATSGDVGGFSSFVTKGNIFFITEADPAVKVYYNGTLLPTTPNGGKYYNPTTMMIMTDAGTAGVADDDTYYAIPKGATIEFIDTADSGNKADVINVIEKEVVTILADPQESFGTVKINGEDINSLFVKGYQDLKKGDIALKVKLGDTTYFEKCKTVTGKLEGTGTFFSTPYYTIAGTNYSLSKLSGNTATPPSNYDYELTFYLDDNGYIVAASEDEVTTTVFYGVVLAAEGNQFNAISGTGAYAKAQILTQTGETVIYDIITGARPDITTANSLNAGDLVRYKLNSANKINVIDAATASDTLTETAQFSTLNFTRGDTTFNGLYLNSNTYFFYYTAASGSTPARYAVIKGYNNAPTVTGVSGFTFASGSIAKAIVMDTVAGGTGEYVFISSSDYTVGRLTDGTTYYNYSCYKDGKLDTIKMDSDLGLTMYDPSGAFRVEKDPVTGIYSAIRLLSPESYLTPNFIVEYTPVQYADETYFVGAQSGGTYNINATSKVFVVTLGVNNAILDVQPAKMVAPSDKYDVMIIGVDTTKVSGTTYTANAVYYFLDPK